MPLISIGALTLASKEMRDVIILYVQSPEGSRRVIPVVQNIPEHSDLDSEEYKYESKRCHDHYKQLGKFFLKIYFEFYNLCKGLKD